MNPQQPGQSPLDYLNQISPTATRRSPLNSKLAFFIIIGIVAVIVVTIVAIVVNATNASQKDPRARLVVVLNSTEEIANESSSKLKSSQLRSLNSSLKLYVTNTERDMPTYLTKANIDPKKLPQAIVQAEANNGMAERLENGRLNAKYDSTYAREMGYQTATILSLLQQLYSQSNSTSTKEFLSNAYDNLQPTQKALADFSAVNE